MFSATKLIGFAAPLYILVNPPIASASTVQTGPTGTGDARAADRADDAFGVRIGTEQIGLYSETLVRGLNLQVSGNYRLAGSYFVRVGNMVDPLLSGVTTRVGYNALGADFASPTGLVEYGLRSPIDSPQTSVSASLMPYGGNLLEGTIALADGSRRGLLIGGQSSYFRSSSGARGQSYRFGVIGEVRPVADSSIAAFFSINDFDFDGNYNVAVRGERLPPRLKHPNRLFPAWGDHDGQDINAGIVSRFAPTDRLSLMGSLIYSRLDLNAADFVLYSLQEDGTGSASITVNRPRDADAYAGAVGASWKASGSGRFFGEIRMRRTYTAFAPAASVRVPILDQDLGLPDVAPPPLPFLPQTLDRTRQISAGIGYEHSFARLRLKGSLQKAHNKRTFSPPGLPESASVQSPWLYDLSAAAAFSRYWTAFATWTRGLEDSGVAPGNAANANDVLPVVVAVQQEIGARGAITPDFTLIASAYTISKPAAGFDANGAYGLSGNLRHRGLELSLTGKLVPSLRMVAGLAYLDASRSGEQVRRGIQSREVPGVSDVTALANLNWSVPGMNGLSIDGQANYASSRRVRSSDGLRAPGYATFDVGALKSFRVGGTDFSLRARIVNIFDSDAWVAQRSELLDRVLRRSIRLSLTARR
ncbi:TonB-dependent receptor [Allosphingosinicella flava]|uniref:TonB-dependent receptor n=1 Tax=Allosphingosinicella flava TaxID=2771430 RepID=UPI001A9C4520|nr:TonB-dependent receptor [Sphingosinicella flava]